jgi:hypothetical protein
MTGQAGSRAGGARPAICNQACGCGWGIVKAQARSRELAERGLCARSRAALAPGGEYDLARRGTGVPGPLTVSEHLELLASGEVLAGTAGTCRCWITP